MESLNFFDALASGRILIIDGAMGTMLQKAGMPPGMDPAIFCLANPRILLDIHKAYIRAGADIITTCTFGANSFKLPDNANVFEINRDLARIARQAAEECGANVLIAGDMGPTGLFAKPLGPLDPQEMIAAFAQQIKGLCAGGIDLVFIETQFDLAEVRASVIAARQTCKLPVMASMTFENGLSLTGSTPEIFAETMQNLGVAACGSNCSLGPDEMRPVIGEFVRVCECPVLAEPNAGLPILENGQTVFPLGPEAFAEKTAAFAKMGAQVLGGCCGTTPEHIRALAKTCENLRPAPKSVPEFRGICLTSRSRLVKIGEGQALALIGERINPTGKPVLARQLLQGDFGEALKLADEQIEAGAQVIDVNVGAPMADEAKLLPDLASLLIERHLAPLSLDSPNPEAIARTLPFSPGSCLVNSISGEAGRMEILGPLCRDFGSPFILLPLTGAKLPETAAERIAIAEKLLEQCLALGISRRLIMVDILALSVSSTPAGAKECLKMASWCQARGFATTVGLSNISFGMPARALLNSTFLCLARGAGLSSCIANPQAPGMQQTLAALAALDGNEADINAFVAGFANWQPGNAASVVKLVSHAPTSLYESVLLGDKEGVEAKIDSELKQGADPFALVNQILIPAITEVGEKYDRKEYFLPQLIRAAETMQKAFARLKPLLEKSGGNTSRPVIVMATVEGDIHDIGKNIVSLLLGNHGFEVIDAGKDAPAASIVDAAIKYNAQVIGLSALMTTTMGRMKDTIELLRSKNLPIKVMVGGAAVTEDFARQIGADAYCDDAVDSVKAAKRFTGQN